MQGDKRERKRVLILFGGTGFEHSISCMSTASVIKHIDTNKFCPILVGVTHEGKWIRWNGTTTEFASRFSTPDAKFIESHGTHVYLLDKILTPTHTSPLHTGKNPHIFTDKTPSADNPALPIKIDVAFILVHGDGGEDGTLQGLLTHTNTPYTGCDVAASAICYNKLYTKQILRSLNFNTVNFASIKRRKWRYMRKEENPLTLLSNLDLPVFVKPSCGGSSIGVSLARDLQEFKKAVDAAFAAMPAGRREEEVLVEEPCTGREIEVGVLQDSDGNILALSTGEILQNELGSAQFYDFKTKYTSQNVAMCPAKLDKDVEKSVKEIAIDVFDKLNLRGFARVDFFLQDGNIIINEINTIPGFTAFSMYPQMAQHYGIPYTELITRIISAAI